MRLSDGSGVPVHTFTKKTRYNNDEKMKLTEINTQRQNLYFEVNHSD